jgi:predicted nuclease with TOPRIM domain
MAETEDRVTRLETTMERIFDRLDRIDGTLARMDGRIDRIEATLATTNTELARLGGRIDGLPGRWTFLVVMLPIATGLFVGLVGVVLALYRMTGAT